MTYPTPETKFIPSPRSPDFTTCFVPLKDGTILELSETQFNQIMAGAVIGGISKNDFAPRQINTYVQVPNEKSSNPR